MIITTITSRYIKTFKDKDGVIDKKMTNKLMLFRVDHGKLLEKHKTVWTKNEDLQNIELNTLVVCNKR